MERVVVVKESGRGGGRNVSGGGEAVVMSLEMAVV